MRILFLAYNHVSISPGGAQQVGAELMGAALAQGHDAHMVVALDPDDAARFARADTAILASPRERGLTYFVPRDYDSGLISCGDWRAIADLRDFIGRLRPDVIHLHHYHRLGVEAIVAARLVAPKATIGLTFHEMIAMCPANGQMVKVPSRQICHEALPEACAQCVPERNADYFALRAERIRTAFAYCDCFAFPSRFLRDLYVRWGLPASKCAVIPNGLAHPAPLFDRTRHSAELNRFAFFGQLIDHKGVEIALLALLHLARTERIPVAGVVFNIHGANQRYATPAYLDELEDLASEVVTASGGRIRILDRGEYRRNEIAARMADTDWVLVPSVWPENDPLVVLEARMFGRPVIGSAAGGMTERIRDGVDGFTFPIRDVRALSDLIAAACGNAETWNRLSAAIPMPPTDRDMFSAYERFWRRDRA